MASAAYGHFLQFCIQYSSIALLYFDYALTFPDEVEYMWRRHFRLSTLLYICCRYALLANVIYLLAQTDKMHSSCDAWYKFDGVISVLGRAAVIATLTLRTYAVFRGTRLILYVLCPIGLMCVILDIMHVPGLGCSHSTGSRTAANILSISMVVFEWTAAILTSVGCIKAIRIGGDWKWSTARLHTLLFKQGLFYLCFASLFTVTAVVLDFTATDGSLVQRIPNALNLPISCLLTARLLLEIRAIQAKGTSGFGESLTTFTAGEESEFITGSGGTATQSMGIRFAMHATIMDDFGDDELADGFVSNSNEFELVHAKPDHIEVGQPADSENENVPVPSARASIASIHQASLRDEEAMIKGATSV